MNDVGTCTAGAAATDQPEEIERLRRCGLSLVNQLAAQAGSAELAATAAALRELADQLRQWREPIPVVGEAKCGKSSFINALIGRPILPTEVDIATSQGFLVSQAAADAFRLRFEDGSAQAVTADDLARYGSHAGWSEAGEVWFDPPLRWIEVDVPGRWLPDGVGLLDTPGLGSFYSSYAQRTARFVADARAVIFVVGGRAPNLVAEVQGREHGISESVKVRF